MCHLLSSASFGEEDLSECGIFRISVSLTGLSRWVPDTLESGVFYSFWANFACHGGDNRSLPAQTLLKILIGIDDYRGVRENTRKFRSANLMSSVNRNANAIRALAMDAVQRAGSGHPGAPMGMADIAQALWTSVLSHHPSSPYWPNVDRFVLANGHGSMLIYSLLHLTGYALSMDELRNFRQLHSKTAGHPEYGETPGVETTTGPLGQGFANAVGMAVAERI